MNKSTMEIGKKKLVKNWSLQQCRIKEWLPKEMMSRWNRVKNHLLICQYINLYEYYATQEKTEIGQLIVNFHLFWICIQCVSYCTLLLCLEENLFSEKSSAQSILIFALLSRNQVQWKFKIHNLPQNKTDSMAHFRSTHILSSLFFLTSQ